MEDGMIQENREKLKRIEQLKEAIDDECQMNLYSPPEQNKFIFQKISNAANMLMNSAFKEFLYAREISDTPKEEKALQEMYKILCRADEPQTLLKKIQKALKHYEYNPYALLVVPSLIPSLHDFGAEENVESPQTL